MSVKEETSERKLATKQDTPAHSVGRAIKASAVWRIARFKVSCEERSYMVTASSREQSLVSVFLAIYSASGSNTKLLFAVRGILDTCVASRRST